MIRRIKNLCLICIGIVLFAMPSYANDLMEQGIYKDSKTGLMWMRCSVGQKWDGHTCKGEAVRLKWKQAMAYPKKFNQKVAFGGYKDWRLPTIAELSSLRYCSKGWSKKITIPNGRKATLRVPAECRGNFQTPTINTQVFPDTLEYFYWTSTVYQPKKEKIWSVYFSAGSNEARNQYYEQYIHLVRDGK